MKKVVGAEKNNPIKTVVSVFCVVWLSLYVNNKYIVSRTFQPYACFSKISQTQVKINSYVDPKSLI